jgi:hypothetical protein
MSDWVSSVQVGRDFNRREMSSSAAHEAEILEQKKWWLSCGRSAADEIDVFAAFEVVETEEEFKSSRWSCCDD